MAVKGVFVIAIALAVIIGLTLPRPGSDSHGARSQVAKLPLN